MIRLRSLVTLTSMSMLMFSPVAAETAQYKQEDNVVYGYKDGMALVMSVFIPEVPNGAGVICVASGAFHSDAASLPTFDRHRGPQWLLANGYVVFAAAHGQKPRYRLQEIYADMPRAVRFVRHNAARFEISPEKIGIMGYSSGAHLSLMAALNPPQIDPEATDPVDRESSRLQAVIEYAGPTDHLNFGQPGTSVVQHLAQLDWDISADFDRFSKKSGRFEQIVVATELEEAFRQTSPVTHVSTDAPPILIFHGTADETIPFQQAESLVERLELEGVDHRLFVAEGVGHNWQTQEGEREAFLGWFERHLLE